MIYSIIIKFKVGPKEVLEKLLVTNAASPTNVPLDLK